MSKRWDNHFLKMAHVHAMMSKDPNTKVGSVIIGADRELISAGFNGFPRGIEDSKERLNDRETKLKLVVHAEMNAVLSAAKFGIKLDKTTLYLVATDGDFIWGGPPCHRCTVEIIQAGIKEVVSHPFKNVPSKWSESINLSQRLLHEAGVVYREVT